VLVVYTGASLSTLQQVACNDDISPGVVQSALTLTVQAHTTYFIQAGSFRGVAGGYQTGTLVLSASSASPAATSTTMPTATPIPTAALVILPTSGTYQQTVALTGTNFGPRETVKVFWDSTAATPLVTPTTSSTGSFVATITVPQATLRTHLVIATGQASGRSAQASFTVLPRVSLAPPSGGQGTTVTMSGYGYGARQTVTAFWNTAGGIRLGMTTTDGVGTFAGSSAITFTVPMSPFGSYKVYGVGQGGHGITSATFDLTPSLILTPTSGHAGSTTTVAGTGYGVGETVRIIFNCTKSTCASPPGTLLASTTASAQGDFSGVSATIPVTATVGTHTMGAIGLTSHAFGKTSFTVN
jgi:hypothetical protein